MDVSFVVPVLNHLDSAQACLDSLNAAIEGLDYEVVLVNDGSDEATADGLRQLAGERIKLVENKRSQGFAHSRNRGAAHAHGKLLVLLQSDLVLPEGWLEPLLGKFDSDPQTGLVGSILRDPATGQISHAGIRINHQAALETLSNPRKRWFRPPLYSSETFPGPFCLAILRERYDALGGFDEAFVTAQAATLDLCLRLNAAKYLNYTANHPGALSTSTHPQTRDFEEKARDERYLQRRWKNEILKRAAQSWPQSYLSRALSGKTSLRSDLISKALVRVLGLTRSTANTASQIAAAGVHNNELRWSSLLDGKTHSEIRTDLCKRFGNWLKDRISYHDFHSASGEREGVWIKETALIELPKGLSAEKLNLQGEIYPEKGPESQGKLGIRITLNDTETFAYNSLPAGSFSIEIENPAISPEHQSQIKIQLSGTNKPNIYAYLGRKLESTPFLPKKWIQHLQTYRPQKLNQRLCLHCVALDDEPVLDFKANPASPQCFEFIRNNSDLGINIVGWHTAELGVGESARVAAKALQASTIAHALVPLKATCLASKGDSTVSHLLQDDNPYPINVFHIDAPQSKDIDPSHGPAFRKGKYNIGYWAWELPEFPDAWIGNFKYFDEIWTPSNFVRNAIAAKSPIPVVTIPHCIDFSLPTGDFRAQLKLPADKFLFCFAYDLNSYQSRKNPQAIIEAYRIAFLAGDRRNDVGLVIKTQSRKRNPEQYAELLAAIEGLPHCYLIDETLPRETVYGLMHSCDCYVSLHRSEGFGLTVAESMFLGKPVISTDWSATSEFLNKKNGCPIDYRLVELKETQGPYNRGQIWADPSTEDAAKAMLKLVNDSVFAKSVGEEAAKTIRERFSPTKVAACYENRLKAMCAW